MAKRAKQKKRGTSRAKNKNTFRWRHRLVWLAVVVGVLCLAAVDVVVYQKFTGKKWSLPSHVYSRPLELYQGLSLSREQLQWELNRF